MKWTSIFLISCFTICAANFLRAQDVCETTKAPIPDIDGQMDGTTDSTWCKIVATFATSQYHLARFDFRLQSLLTTQEEKESETFPDPANIWSVAFIVLNYKYDDSFDPRANAAVEGDKARLLSFLKDQRFDEIVLLENETATKNNIRKVLDWLARRFRARSQDSANRTRFLFLYEGHGEKGDQPTDVGSLVLSAPSNSGEEELFDINSLSGDLKSVATHATQSAFFLVACYAGGIVGAPPSSIGHSSDRASIAVAASNNNSAAWLNSENTGSVFFDEFLGTIDRKKKYYDSVTDVSEHLAVARKGLYVTEEEMNELFDAGGPRFKKYKALGFAKNGPPFVAGNLDPFANQVIDNGQLIGVPLADFYFTIPLSDIELVKFSKELCAAKGFEDSLACPFADSHAPGWRQRNFRPTSAKGVSAHDLERSPSGGSVGNIFLTQEADLGDDPVLASPRAVFDVPETYAYHGLDASHYSGKIDWEKIPLELRQFVYLKSTQSGSHKDGLFDVNMAGARAAGSKVGAYHVVDFCSPVSRQFENIKGAVPADDDLMPLALSVELWSKNVRCQGSDGDRVKLITDLANRVKSYYGKQPIFFVMPEQLGEFDREPLVGFALWVKGRQEPSVRSNAGALQGVAAQGRAWTIWQYKTDRRLVGVPDRVDFDVFFGGTAGYEMFVHKGINAAGLLRSDHF